MSLFGPTTVTAVLGSRGCGKTFLSMKIQSLYPRVVVIDLTGEYLPDGEYHTEGDLNCFDFDDFCDALKKSMSMENFRIIYHSNMDAKNDEVAIDEIVRLVLIRSSAPEATHNNVLLVLEEVQNYSNPHSLPHYQKYNFLTGRHHGVATLVCSQRPGEVHKTILSQAENLFCGTCFEGNDIKWLSQRLDKKAEELKTLPYRDFLYHRLGDAPENVKRVKNTLD